MYYYLQATAWVKTYSEKAYKAELAKKSIAAAAAEASSPPHPHRATTPPSRPAAAELTKYGRGAWFDVFVEEYGDMINTKKLAEKVERKRLGLPAKAKTAATATSSSSYLSTFKRNNKKGGAGGPCPTSTVPADDAYNVLITLWMAVLIFKLTRYIMTKKEVVKKV